MSSRAPLKRLHVVIAESGLASRRAAESLIVKGLVRVNGILVTTFGTKVDPAKDQIEVKGKVLQPNLIPTKKYFLFHKPLGVTTTLSDPHAKKTIAEYIQDVPERLYPVGRLDQDSTGLLLLTNDGELAHRLTHPSFGVKKRYRVILNQDLSEEYIKKLRAGVLLEANEKTAPCEIQKLKSVRVNHFKYSFVLHEGKKRQIRRMVEKVGARVISLHREAYGPLTLGKLKSGGKKELSKNEIQTLKSIVGLP